MTDPSISIPLHFTLEFAGIAAYGGLLSWSVLQKNTRATVAALGLLSFQVLHAGLFVSLENEALLGIGRAVSLVVLSLPISRSKKTPAVIAAAGNGNALYVAGLAGAATAFLTPIRDRRRLWMAAWLAIAGGDALTAATTEVGGVLQSDFAGHLVRMAGFAGLGAWTWFQIRSSLRLRLVAAFGLALFVVVAVSGGAVTRVVAADRADAELVRLSGQARTQAQRFERDNRQLGLYSKQAALALAPLFSNDSERPRRIEQAAGNLLQSGLLGDTAFLVVFDGDRRVLASPGVIPAEDAMLSRKPPLSPDTEVLKTSNGLIAIASALSNADGLVAAGTRLGTSELRKIRDQTQSEVLLVESSGAVLAATTRGLWGADLSVKFRDISTGKFGSPPDAYLFAAAPLTNNVVFVVASNSSFIGPATTSVSRALFAAVLAAALIAMIIALWMGTRISRPVVSLTDTARRVESGDLQAAVRADSPDEIGTLARAFSSMTSALRSTISSEQQTRAQQEAIVQGIGEGLAAMDADFNLVAFNSAAEAITGVPKSQALGMKCYDVYGHSTKASDGRPICESICPLKYSGGDDAGVEIRTDGRTHSLAVTCSPLLDADGKITGGVDLLRDVTAARQAELLTSTFLSNVSHELRTPLTPIRGYAALLRKPGLRPAARAGYLEEIERNAAKLERTIQMLVDVAEMRSGKIKCEFARISVSELVSSTAKRWRKESHKIRAKSDPADVRGDIRLLERVLDELVSNAIKFSPDAIEIVIQSEKCPGGVRVSVTDHGVGLDPAQLPELTADFVQLDPSQTRRFGGLGVGLGFVRRALESHESKLDVESSPGAGATFSFVLKQARVRR